MRVLGELRHHELLQSIMIWGDHVSRPRWADQSTEQIKASVPSSQQTMRQAGVGTTCRVWTQILLSDPWPCPSQQIPS